jgi:DNA-binding transcriptional MerR regulator
MNDGDPRTARAHTRARTPERLLTIGELAALTEVPVRTIRFYSDEGLVEPAQRSAGGYRLYHAEAAARLELVRTLRELGIDLATVRRVLDRQVTVAQVAAAHAAALEAEVRVLRLRQAVLRAVAVRDCDWKELELMHRLARLDAAERARILDGFLDTVFGGLPGQNGPGGSFAAMIRSVFPALPEEPTEAQVEAWVELVALIRDEAFTARMRQMAELGARKHAEMTDEQRALGERAHAEILAPAAAQACEEGLDPRSPEGAARAGQIAAAWLTAGGMPVDAAHRADLLQSMETFTDRRVYRFWSLVRAVGDPTPQMQAAPPPGIEAMEWFIIALRTARDSAQESPQDCPA